MTERHYGEKGFEYEDKPKGRFNHVVYLNTYVLSTGDSFEVGGAYALHVNKKSALGERKPTWWAPRTRAEIAFVTEGTLEKIAKTKDKFVFKSWEN